MNSGVSSWRSLLLRVGDKCPEYGGAADVKEQIDACYGYLLREMEHSKDDILVFFLQCAEQLPHKIPFYGVLVGLINIENEDFSGKVVDLTQKNLQDSLFSGDCNRIRILMRFVAVLMCSKVILPGSVVEMFEALLSSAATTVDEEVGNPAWQSRADFYVICILSCLPWCGAELSEQVPDEIDRVMAGIQSYFSIRKCAPKIGLKVFQSIVDTDTSEKDFLEDLWDRVQDMMNNGWKAESVPRPHLQFEAQLVLGQSHDFTPVCCPEQPPHPPLLSTTSFGKEKHAADLKYPQRLLRLNIFPASKVENMQPIDRFVVEEYILDVLFFFNGCRKECAAYLVGLPVSFRYEYLMAETVFSQLLLLPQPTFKPFYYTLVIIDLCKALPGAFPSVVAGAVRALFEKISDMDMECRSRLILWFSHHLSNFQFFWPWEEWAYVVDLPKWAPRRVFVQEVLDREVRLSYWEKIKQSIDSASSLEGLLPPSGGPCFKYGTEDKNEMTEGHKFSLELCSMVKGRKMAREISLWAEENIVPVHGHRVALEVVIQTLLDIGSKSFTHLTTVLERYGQVITGLCSDHEKQVLLIEEVSLFWKNSTQMTAVTIDRMMAYRLISNLAIVAWVFSPANVDRFHLSDSPWEILTNATNKTYHRISDLRKEISSLKKSILLSEESALKARNEFETAEAKLEVVNGEPVQVEKPGRLKRLKAYAEKAKEELTSLNESLEAKEALLSRALEENKALFYSLYRNFANVFMERLPRVFTNRMVHDSNGNIDDIADDSGGASKMQVDQDEGKLRNSHLNGGRVINSCTVGEQDQWCRSTLGYVKALSRQYSDEIWVHVDKLETEVFHDAHPLFKRAVYSGLGWLPEI